MTIASLQLPAWQPPRDLDFSALARLPQAYRLAQRDAWTLANIDRLHAAQELTRYEPVRPQRFPGKLRNFRRTLGAAAGT